MVKVKFSPSTNKDKKYKAVFYSDSGEKIKTTHFGYSLGSNYIDHKDDKKKDAWIARHLVRGTFNDYKSASGLSRWILWNKPTLTASINDYKNKFNLK